MHIDRSYSKEEAKRIYGSVQSFMQHLADSAIKE
jgi:hypothetical protein